MTKGIPGRVQLLPGPSLSYCWWCELSCHHTGREQLQTMGQVPPFSHRTPHRTPQGDLVKGPFRVHKTQSSDRYRALNDLCSFDEQTSVFMPFPIPDKWEVCIRKSIQHKKMCQIKNVNPSTVTNAWEITEQLKVPQWINLLLKSLYNRSVDNPWEWVLY